ncbi:MAG TPA: hypothetical protein VGO26_10770 [Amnibacterium sp.]|nr:hypothetical protein [Amnibacterium sp.]
MSDTTIGTDGPALLRTSERGVPVALDWRARRYHVTDAPTRIEDALGMLLTHPLPVRGWRFQGTSGDGTETLVFDVLLCDDAWRVVKTYR